MTSEDLIACAELLINRPGSPSTQADINRAASTLYYSLFHVLSSTCANFFMGPMHEDYRRAWQQAYRALGHDYVKERCRDSQMMAKFPSSIQDFATKFITLQELRHQCDYDPLSETTKTTVETEIESIRDVIRDFRATPELDLRSYCSFVIFPKRDDPLRRKIEQQRSEDRARILRAEQEGRRDVVRAERAAQKAARKPEKDEETTILSHSSQLPP